MTRASMHEATEEWAAWDCAGPASCRESHCARCGQHCGGQGDTCAGFIYDRCYYEFRRPSGGFDIVMWCDEAAMTEAMRHYYGDKSWIEDAIAEQRSRFRPDRRKRDAAKTAAALRPSR